MIPDRSIPFARPWITDTERNAVFDVLNGDILTHGPQNKAFEEEFSYFLGGGNCIAVSSCMAALHLAYWQMGIGPGDEVLVASQTHVATAHAVEVVGAKPIFIDCEQVTGNINPELLVESITSNTKAIGLVHFLGIPCDMEPIMEIAEDNHLKVVEDCALAIGAKYKGTHVGLIGDCGCYSFYPVKHMTTGDGGMFVSKDVNLTGKVGKARAFGVDRDYGDRNVPGMYDVPTLGLNYRMSDINASIGREQLKRIENILEIRKRNFYRLKSIVSCLPGIFVIDSPGQERVSSHYCLTIVLKLPYAPHRTKIIQRLNALGVGTSIYYPQPVPRMAYYQKKYGYHSKDFPQAEKISDNSIALPIGPHLSDEDINYIGSVVQKVMEEFSWVAN